MSRRTAVAVASAALWLAAAPPPARARTSGPHPAASRLLLGGGIGAPLGSPARRSSMGGADADGLSDDGGVFVRYERRAGDLLSLAATGGYFTWLNSAANDAGYMVQRVDVGLAAQLRPRRTPDLGILRTELYISLPVGVSSPFVRVPARRALDEQHDGELGWYVGAGLGGVLIGESFGVFFEAQYVRRAGTIRSVFTPHDGTQPPVVEVLDYVDHALVFNAGGLVAF